jgi:hypothetical protein
MELLPFRPMKNEKWGFSTFLFGSKLAKISEGFIQLMYKENTQNVFCL